LRAVVILSASRPMVIRDAAPVERPVGDEIDVELEEIA
jgi:hypothetical protein